MIDFDPSPPPRPALPVLEYASGPADPHSGRTYSRSRLVLEFLGAILAIGFLGVINFAKPPPVANWFRLALAGTLFAGMLAIVNSVRGPAHQRWLTLFLGIMELALATTVLLFVVTIPSRPDPSCRITAAKSDFATFEGKLEQFNVDMDRYPTAAEGLAALV
jgi:hypothetical protein